MPLPTNILAEDTREIIREAECVALVISAAEVPALARVMRDCATVRNIFVMDGCALCELGCRGLCKGHKHVSPQCMPRIIQYNILHSSNDILLKN